MTQKTCNCKAKIDYPCQWLYKVIGADQEQLLQAIAEIIPGTSSCDINHSNSSSEGKYHCLNVELTVQNEKERNSIYSSLKEHPHVKIVL